MNPPKRISNWSLQAAVASAAVAITSAPPCNAEITRFVVFGDSYTDSGNAFIASGGRTNAPPYWEGRASNGPVWVEHLADYLGAPRPLANREGGTNAAFGSAPTGHGTCLDSQIPPVEIPRLGAQIEEILASHTLGPGDLVVIWGGHVDLFNPDLCGPITAAQVVDNLTDHIRVLQDAGATNFLVNNLYPGEPFGAVNTLWSARADELRRTEPIRLHLLDFGRLWVQIENNPARFGFTSPDWRQPIMGRVVDNPDEYAFWDTAHPTTAFHRVIADAALETLRHIDGDYNDNGLVEQGDLDLVLLNWGQRVTSTFVTTTGWSNDLPTRRLVDQDELDRVLLHWGQSPLVPAARLGAAAVPEPASLVLLLTIIATMLVARRGQRTLSLAIARTTSATSLLIAFVFVAIVGSPANGQALIDDFNDGNDDGWTHWGGGNFDANSFAYNFTSASDQPAGNPGGMSSTWDASADPVYNDGIWRATVRAEPGGTNVAFILRGGVGFGSGYVVATTLDGRLRVFDLAGTISVGGALTGFSRGEDWKIEAGAVGDTIFAKAWRMGDPEPLPQVIARNSQYPTGQFSVAAFIDSAWQQPARVNATFDDIEFTRLIAGVPGDYNANGMVDQADLDLVLLHWGSMTRQLNQFLATGWYNDLPTRLVDQDELDKVLLNWGATVASPSTAGVPEASSVVLTSLAGLAALFCFAGRVSFHRETNQ